MKRLTLSIILPLVFAWVTITHPTAAQSADEPMVRAVLFYSPNCPHCHRVINEVLLPMLEEYGGQLQVVGIDTSQPAGAQLYELATVEYQVSAERRGVPTLVIDDAVLVGSQEIPDQFPVLVEQGLAAGGIDWPDIPGLARLLSVTRSEPSPTAVPLEAANPVSTATPTSEATPTVAPSHMSTAAPAMLTVGDDEIPQEQVEEAPPGPLGMSLAGVVLVGMVAVVGLAVWRMMRPGVWQQLLRSSPAPLTGTWAIPCLCMVGLGVASYLAYVEINQVKAICGPVGECNVVQSSEYALFLGVPVAVWGVLNYLSIALLWAGQRFLDGWPARLSLLGLLGLSLFGTLFSIYLTCLELFAIHAVCAWCLGSAVATTAVMLLAVIPTTTR